MAHVSVCDIDPEVKTLLHKFKFRKEKDFAAIVLKIDTAKQLVILDEEYRELENISELVDELTASQPRYIVISYVYKQDDGRVSYPLMIVFFSPQGCKPEHQMMYAGTYKQLVQDSEITKMYEIRELEDLTEEFILTKLKFYK